MKITRDPHTGRNTTGHEWNGITELAGPVPFAVWLFLFVTFVFSVVCWILLPSWPVGTTYTKGVLHKDQRSDLSKSIAHTERQRADWIKQIENKSYKEIIADSNLMNIVTSTGARLYTDNCSACHGTGGQGGPGYPRLSDKTWLWGNSYEQIHETIKSGVNSQSDESRSSEMPAFGKAEMLEKEDINLVVDYIYSFTKSGTFDTAALNKGKQVFLDNCAACHGEDAKGNADTGAPNLTDDFWLYGNDPESIYRSVFHGRKGHMPHWNKRLKPHELKILTLYVSNLKKEK